MRVFVAVLAFAAVAAAGVLVDQPVEMPVAEPVVESVDKKVEPVARQLVTEEAVEPIDAGLMEGRAIEVDMKKEPVAMERSVMEEVKASAPVEEVRASAPVQEDNILMKMDPSDKLIGLYSDPNVLESMRTHEQGGMKSVLEGPVMVAFKDTKEDHMTAYLLRHGFRDTEDSAWKSISSASNPFGRFLFDGKKKAFLYLSAGNLLQLPEMYKTISDIQLPGYKLGNAYEIAKHFWPYPYLLIVDAASIQDRVASLKEHGVFMLEKDGLKIVKDNFPMDSAKHGENPLARSIQAIIASRDLIGEIAKPLFVEKDMIGEYTKPVYVEKDLISEYAKPIYAERDFVRAYAKPIYGEKDIIREYTKPVYTETDLIRDFFKPTYAERDYTRGYPQPIYAERDMVSDYAKPIYTRYTQPAVYTTSDLFRDYTRPVYQTDLYREYTKPIYTGYTKPVYVADDDWFADWH